MAAWIHARWPQLAPSDLRAGSIRIFAAFVLAHFAVPAAGYAVQALSAKVERAVIGGVGFAALVFLMLAVLWMLRLARGLMGGMLR